jgi:UDP-galactopyranose mutase
MPSTLHQLHCQLHQADYDLEQLLEKRNEIQQQIERFEARKVMHTRGDMFGKFFADLSAMAKEDHVKAVSVANTFCMPCRNYLSVKYFKHALETIPHGALPLTWTQAEAEAFFEAVQCALERDMTAMLADSLL